MICPHCEYEHGCNYDLDKEIKGDKGTFYELPIEMTKRDAWESETEIRILYACPSCGKTFIDIEE